MRYSDHPASRLVAIWNCLPEWASELGGRVWKALQQLSLAVASHGPGYADASRGGPEAQTKTSRASRYESRRAAPQQSGSGPVGQQEGYPTCITEAATLGELCRRPVKHRAA